VSTIVPLLILLARPSLAEDQTTSATAGVHLRPDTFVVDTRLSQGAVENMTRLYVDADAFVAALKPSAPAPVATGTGARALTGHLHLVNRHMDEAVVKVNGTSVGHVHALTEAAVRGAPIGCYDVSWEYRDDYVATEQVCTVDELRTASPGGPAAAMYLETGRPARTEPPWRYGPADKDRDGVADTDDECPAEAGPAASFGCPDGDADHVPDFRDACPLQAGPAKADPRRSDGCPARVFIAEKEIVITDRIFFQTNKATILPESFPLLDEIAQILIKHDEVLKVEVGGHTDSTGNATKNVKLSQDRAQSVLNYLKNKGIDASRLEAKGFGPNVPIADNATTEGKATNRRVEFKILDQKSKMVEIPPAPKGAEQPTERTLERGTGG